MIIQSRFKEYEVKFEQSLEFLRHITQTTNAEYVIDAHVFELYQEYFTNIPTERLCLIQATEENKVIDSALEICEKMTEIPAKRNVHLISIGGGIIQDITGFVASILYRGIPWTFIPTTLLAACDSCIGGKTSLNYRKFKNLLGTFYAPDVLFICPAFFQTLTQRDFESGMGEVIKFNIMGGEDGLANIECNLDLMLRRDGAYLQKVVQSSLAFKKIFIEIDEFNKGERIKLNFAHTFGHAIETITHYAIPHGTAVAIGMIMANDVAYQRGLLCQDIAIRSETQLLRVIHIDIRFSNYALSDFIYAMRKDKKQTSDQLTVVLMTNAARELIIVHDLTEQEVAHAIEHFHIAYTQRELSQNKSNL